MCICVHIHIYIYVLSISIYLYLSLSVSICLYLSLSIYLPTYLPPYLLRIYLLTYLSTDLSRLTYLSLASLSTCPTTYFPICLVTTSRSTCITNMSGLTCKCEGIGPMCTLCPAYTNGEPQQPPYQSLEQLRQMQPSQNLLFGNKNTSANLHAHAGGMFASRHLCTFIAMAVSAQSAQMESRNGLHSNRPFLCCDAAQ